MNTEAVVEFLGNVPLLQRLPSSSFKRIAELVNFKHFEKGDYVVREGEVGDGIYFVWEGGAEVSVSVHVEEENRLEFQFQQYDYFGHVNPTLVLMADVIALTKMTCLFLPHEHCTLLQSKSICAPVESILHLEPIEMHQNLGRSMEDNWWDRHVCTSFVPCLPRMWFHRNPRADDRLLLVIVSPTACNNRCFLSGQMFNRKGELGVSLTQEVLLKMVTPPNPSANSKL